MKAVYCFFFLVFSLNASSQKISERIEKAFEKFEADSQVRTAISSLYVVNAKTGEIVFDKNGKTGLATASTLKVITAASAYEMLGKDFRYETSFIIKVIGTGKHWIDIETSGDPSFGSWRWPHNNRFNVMNRVVSFVVNSKANVTLVSFKDLFPQDESIPGGWIWEDIGNYYGASPQSLNWNENQFDIVLRSGNSIGSEVQAIETNPRLYNYQLKSEVKAAAKGTGDNAYIYFPVGRESAIIRGTIPVGENRFVISGSMPDAVKEFSGKLMDTLNLLKENKIYKPMTGTSFKPVSYKEVSPRLDSLAYWFLKKSINLYGEVFVKTIARLKTAKPTADSGIDTIVSFWKKNGIDPAELRMVDGSGLSPLNRVTTHAQVQVLQYAKKQSWFNGYYDAFPEFNGMKAKSGTINGVKGFCGYHKAADGNEYIFSFLVNNYNGSASELVKKMYKVLDVLK